MNNYEKTDICVKNWLVSQDDINRIVEFIKGRFLANEVVVEIKNTSGHSRTYVNLEEMALSVKKSLDDKVIIQEIGIYKEEIDFGKIRRFRKLSVRIYFDDILEKAYFYISANDTDDSLGDWVEGTYSEAKILAKRFEIVDNELIDKIKKRFNKGVVLDFDGKIKKEIQEEIIRDKEIKLVSISIHNNITNSVNGSSPGLETRDPKDGFLNRILKHPIISTVIASLIMLFFIYMYYKYTGINLNNPSENKITISNGK